MDLDGWSAQLRLLSDPTRVRLLKLLEREELTVAELSAATHLAQPRVSTHLARLREASLVHDRRAGVSVYYRLGVESAPQAVRALWATISEATDDALLREDLDRLQRVLSARASAQNWADTVAGDMERHYSPGRTWETLARCSVQLAELGDVLDVASGDGVLAELLAPQARSITCIDASPRVVAAASERLAQFAHVEVCLGDMHALPCPDAAFDVVFLMHALTYTTTPAPVVAEAARVLRPGGRLMLATLAEHAHRSVVEPFGHVQLGYRPDALVAMAESSGLEVLRCGTISRERNKPHFEVLSLLARRQ